MLRVIQVPIKCWKNLPSSISVRARAHLLLRAQTCSSSVASPIAKIPKGDLEAMPRVTQKQRNWTPKSAVCALHSLCAPCVHGTVAHHLLLQMQKFQRETWRQWQEWLGNKEIKPQRRRNFGQGCHFSSLWMVSKMHFYALFVVVKMRGRPLANDHPEDSGSKRRNWGFQ